VEYFTGIYFVELKNQTSLLDKKLQRPFYFANALKAKKAIPQSIQWDSLF